MNDCIAGEPSRVEVRALIKAEAARVHRGLTSGIEQSAIAGGHAVIEPTVGGKLLWAGGRLGTITGTVEQIAPDQALVLALDPLHWLDGWGLGPERRVARVELTVRDLPSGSEIILRQHCESVEQARCMEYEWRTFYLTPLQAYFERWSAARAASEAPLAISTSAAFCWGDARITILSEAGGAFFELPRALGVRLLEIFATPTPRGEALSRVDAAERAQLSEAIDALLGTLVLVPGDQSTAVATRTRWEPHDRLFHHISNAFGNHGWHQLGDEEPLPAVKPPSSGPAIVLPDAELPEIPLRAALTARRSAREFARRRVSLDTLSAFLHSARNVRGAAARRWNHEWLPGDYVSRVYPSGGALYSTEVYLLVAPDRIERVGAGAYHYCPARHVLEELCTGSDAVVPTLEAVSSESRLRPPPGPPPLLTPAAMVVISSRLGRVSYKYGGFAYSLVLQEVGAMHQTFSLVCAALGLGGCALGASPGAVRLLHQRCAVSPRDEPVVGFYMLGAI